MQILLIDIQILSHFSFLVCPSHLVTVDDHVDIAVGLRLAMFVLRHRDGALRPVPLTQPAPGGDQDLQHGPHHHAVDRVQGEGEQEELLPELDHPLEDRLGHGGEEAVLGEEDELDLGQEIVAGVEGQLQGPDGSLQDLSLHVTPYVVLDEALGVPDDLEDELERLSAGTASAPPEECSVLTEVGGAQLSALPHWAEDGAVEGSSLRGIRAPGAGAGEPPVVTQQLGPPGLTEIQTSVPSRDLLPGQDLGLGLHLEAGLGGEDGAGVGDAAVVHDGVEEVEPSAPGAGYLTQRLPVDKKLVVTPLELRHVDITAKQSPHLLRHLLLDLRDLSVTNTQIKQFRYEALVLLQGLFLEKHPDGGESSQECRQSVLVQVQSPSFSLLLNVATLELVVRARETLDTTDGEETERTLEVHLVEEGQTLHAHHLLPVPAGPHTPGLLHQEGLQREDGPGGHQVPAQGLGPADGEGPAGVVVAVEGEVGFTAGDQATVRTEVSSLATQPAAHVGLTDHNTGVRSAFSLLPV